MLVLGTTGSGKSTLVRTVIESLMLVETDEDVSKGSLRESLRLRPDVLRRLGWHYLRVHSFELFADPDAVAGRIAKLIGKPEPEPETAPITLPTL